MRIDGTLAKWNDDRGFGFISPVHGGSEIFVHVSTFPRDGQRPRIGERLSFEIEADKNGKKRAINLVCLDRQVKRVTRQNISRHHREKRSFFGRFVQLAVVVALITYGYVEYSHRSTHKSAVAAQTIEQTTSEAFHCDGRIHCSQMTSCDEAMLFLKNCPHVQMDGDYDGIPCEKQWCN